MSVTANTPAIRVIRAMKTTQGAGLDIMYVFKHMRNNVLRMKTEYHLMNETGYYTCWIPVVVWIPLDNSVDFKIRCRNTGNCDGLRDYLTDLFYNALSGVQL